MQRGITLWAVVFGLSILILSAAPAAAAVAPAAELSEWRYSLCDESFPSVYRYTVTCTVWYEGQWVVYPSGGRCEGGQPLDTEEELVPKAVAFERQVHNACNIQHTWTGFGVPVQSYTCGSGDTVFRDGIEMTSFGIIDTWGDSRQSDGSCQGQWQEKVYATRNRQFFCPQGYYLSGGTRCQPNGEANPHKNNNKSCEAVANGSNPVHTALGFKLQTERDYAGPEPYSLRFERYYTSGDHWVHAAIGQHWRHTYARRVDARTLGGVTTATVYRANGDRYYFNLAADGSWRPDADVHGRLTRLENEGWRYRTEEDTTEIYDAIGRLRQRTDRSGLTTRLSYGEDGRLQTVTGPFGRTLAFQYGESGNITSLLDPSGARYTYEYDERGNLTAVVYPDDTPLDSADNPRRQYRYEDPDFPHALSAIIDARGVTRSRWIYDRQGRAIESVRGEDANRVRFAYHDDSTTVTGPLGEERLYQHRVIEGVARITAVSGGPCPSCGALKQNQEYDEAGNVTRQTDWNGNVTTYAYNDRGLVIRRTEAAGSDIERTVTTEWHPDLRLPTRIVGPLTERRIEYDDVGRPLSEVVVDRASGAERLTRYAYTAAGLLESVDGPRTDVADITRYQYDAQGNLTAVVNALGQRVTISDHDAHGHPQRLIEASGLLIRLEYDARGRLTARQAGSERTEFRYDPAGNLIALRLPGGREIRYRYDPAARLIGIQDDQGNRVDYTLDALGNRIRTEIFDPEGSLTLIQRQTFDAMSRLIEQIGAGGQIRRMEYDPEGNLIAETDPLGRTTSHQYDPLRRLIATLDPAGGASTYGYDSDGHLSAVTDPRGLTTQYAHDAFGNTVRVDSPDTGVTAVHYDNAGNAISRTDAAGRTSEYDYDALGRLTQARFADGAVHRYRYDETVPGTLSAIEDPSGIVTWRYDAHSRVLERRQEPAGGPVLDVQWTYDGAGRLIGQRYPSGAHITYTYQGGELASLHINGEPLLTAVDHQPFGPAAGWRWSNGEYYERRFDLDGRISAHSLPGGLREFAYDDAGQITAARSPGGNQHFAYDSRERLIEATGTPGGPQTYTYDRVGNRLTQTIAGIITTYTYAADSNRLTHIHNGETRPITHDPSGAIIEDGKHRYDYDARGRLVGVDDTAVRYTINALGQRIAKHSAPPGDADSDAGLGPSDILTLIGLLRAGEYDARADCNNDGILNRRDLRCLARSMTRPPGAGRDSRASRYFLYDNQGRLLGEYDAHGNPFQETVYLQGTPIAVIHNATAYHLYPDHLGTPRAITDETAEVIWRWESDPFGLGLPDEDPDGNGEPFAFNLRLPGQYYDQETGLHYNYFRYYDPSAGRYITSDPIGLKGGLNTYLYVKANPLRFMDLRGLDNVGCTTDPITIDGRCKRICCAIHDKCYDDNNCTADSWTSDKGCNAEACDKCNKNVVKCFVWCDQAEPMGIEPAPGTPEYYCPAQHRYIRIPGDFPTVEAAKAACGNQE